MLVLCHSLLVKMVGELGRLVAIWEKLFSKEAWDSVERNLGWEPERRNLAKANNFSLIPLSLFRDTIKHLQIKTIHYQ